MTLSKLFCTVTCASFLFTAPLHAVEPTTFPGPKNSSPLMKKKAGPKQVRTKKTKKPEEGMPIKKEAIIKNNVSK